MGTENQSGDIKEHLTVTEDLPLSEKHPSKAGNRNVKKGGGHDNPKNVLDDLILDEPYRPEWVVTFSDLITVLLVFFVILQATSTFSPTKFHEAISSIEKVFNDTNMADAETEPPPPLLLAPPAEEAIPGQGLFEVSINSGFFRYSSGKLGKLKQAEGMHHTILKTPTAKIGIRGSSVKGHVASNGATTFVHHSGILHVSDLNGENIYRLDTPGQTIHYEPGEPFPSMKDSQFTQSLFEKSGLPDHATSGMRNNKANGTTLNEKLGKSVGTVRSIQQSLAIKAKNIGGMIRLLKRDSPVYMHDIIELPKGEGTTIIMNDDTTLELGSLARISLDKFAYNPDVPLEELQRSREEIRTLLRQVNQQIRKRRLQLALSAETNDDITEVVIRVKDSLLFNSGSGDLLPSALPYIDHIKDIVNPHTRFKVNIRGHTDNIPIKTRRYPSNWELSAIRATSVLRRMISQGVDPMRLTATGYGDLLPTGSNSSEIGRARNRRVEFALSRDPGVE